jgi:hypothetical protein
MDAILIIETIISTLGNLVFEETTKFPINIPIEMFQKTEPQNTLYRHLQSKLGKAFVDRLNFLWVVEPYKSWDINSANTHHFKQLTIKFDVYPESTQPNSEGYLSFEITFGEHESKKFTTVGHTFVPSLIRDSFWY